ncbi:OLC1v1011549C1 [Oldenlandia corymbosa var. corymbosa]|uniref:OLC1v1011549C1 n=1 Tax=Oldenlandia corymbosa var. corymbosa TaxID=529605 RepID=A0AAV1DWX5_OLDCO|nr:OLC1v1011549C1 [Oldenlandia corymbosa var. corymbosa]
MNHLASGFSLADLYPSVKLLQVLNPTRHKMERGQKQIDEIFGSILKEHKQKVKPASGESSEDLIDVLVGIQQRKDFQPQLTNECIKADIFTAGSETSAIVIEWALAEMIKNPEVMERAQHESSLQRIRKC